MVLQVPKQPSDHPRTLLARGLVLRCRREVLDVATQLEVLPDQFPENGLASCPCTQCRQDVSVLIGDAGAYDFPQKAQ